MKSEVLIITLDGHRVRVLFHLLYRKCLSAYFRGIYIFTTTPGFIVIQVQMPKCYTLESTLSFFWQIMPEPWMQFTAS